MHKHASFDLMGVLGFFQDDRSLMKLNLILCMKSSADLIEVPINLQGNHNQTSPVMKKWSSELRL